MWAKAINLAIWTDLVSVRSLNVNSSRLGNFYSFFLGMNHLQTIKQGIPKGVSRGCARSMESLKRGRGKLGCPSVGKAGRGGVGVLQPLSPCCVKGKAPICRSWDTKPCFTRQLGESGEGFLPLKVCSAWETMEFTGDLRTQPAEVSVSSAAATMLLEQGLCLAAGPKERPKWAMGFSSAPCWAIQGPKPLGICFMYWLSD